MSAIITIGFYVSAGYLPGDYAVLFGNAGSGGMALGLQQAGLDVVAAVEINKSCVETLKANKAKAFPKMEIIQEDITTLSSDYLLKKVGLAKGQLDVLSGGPPCQGFTFASSRRSIKDPRSGMGPACDVIHRFGRLRSRQNTGKLNLKNQRTNLGIKMKMPFLPVHIIRSRRLKKIKDEAFAEGKISNKKLICDLLDTNNQLTGDVKMLSGGKTPHLKRRKTRRKTRLKAS